MGSGQCGADGDWYRYRTRYSDDRPMRSARIKKGHFSTLEQRAGAFEDKLRTQSGAGIVGYLAWGWWNGSVPVSDGFEIGPGDPALRVLDYYWASNLPSAGISANSDDPAQEFSPEQLMR